MSEPGSWTTPDGWGGPSQRPASPPPGQGQPSPPPGDPGSSLPPGHGGAPPQAYGPPPQAYGPPPQAYGAAPQPGAGASGAVPPPGWGPRPVEVKPGVVPLRPLGLGELLDGAVGIIRRYPRPTLALSALVAVVTTLLNVALIVTAFQPFLELDPALLEGGDTASFEGAIGAAAAGSVLAVILATLSGAILAGALAAVVGKAVLGEPTSFGQVWTQLRPRLLALIGLALLVLLIVYGILAAGMLAGVGLIALGAALPAFVGGLVILASLAGCAYAYIRLSLAPCVLVLEHTGILTSLRRSGVLVKRDWWRVFGILLLTAVIGLFVSQIVELPFAVLGAGSAGSLFDPEANALGTRALVVSAIGAGLAATLVGPFTAGVRALLYVDRRMRAEGLDVALSAAAAGRR